MTKAGPGVQQVESSVRDLIFVLFRQKRKIISFAILVLGIVATITFMTSPMYHSEAKLLLRVGRASVTPEPALEGGGMPWRLDWASAVGSEIEILKSIELLEEVVADIGIAAWTGVSDDTSAEDRTAPEARMAEARGESGAPNGSSGAPRPRPLTMDDIVKRVQSTLVIEAIPVSNIISVSYEETSPEMAQKVISRLVDLYIKRHQTLHRSQGSFEFFENQAKVLEQRIADTEGLLRAIKIKTSFASIEDARRTLMERYAGVKRDIDATASALAGATGMVETLKKLSALVPEMVKIRTDTAPNLAINPFRIRLMELKLELKKLETVYKKDSVKIKEITDQIEALEDLLKPEPIEVVSTQEGINQQWTDIKIKLVGEQANLDSLQAKAGALKTQLEESKKALDSLAQSEEEIKRLERELEIHTANYRKYRDNLEQARIDKEIESKNITNISIVQRATFNDEPVRPRKKVNLALGLLLGIIGGLGIAFFSEFLDHSFSRPEDVERRLALPTLVSIPRLRRRKALLPVKKLAPVPATAAGAAAANGGDGSEEPRDVLDLSDRLRQHFEALRTRVTLSNNGAGPAGPPIIAVTSSQLGEGTSTVAANLAISFSKSRGNRVLFADVSGTTGKRPLAFVRQGAGDPDISVDEKTGKITLKPSRIGTLDVLYGLGEYDGSKWLPGVFEILRRHYSVIVMDTPPVLDANSGVRWAKIADQAVVVLEAERIRWEVASRAKDLLDQSKVNVIGVVLNKRQYHVPSWLYSAM